MAKLLRPSNLPRRFPRQRNTPANLVSDAWMHHISVFRLAGTSGDALLLHVHAIVDMYFIMLAIVAFPVEYAEAAAHTQCPRRSTPVTYIRS